MLRIVIRNGITTLGRDTLQVLEMFRILICKGITTLPEYFSI